MSRSVFARIFLAALICLPLAWIAWLARSGPDLPTTAGALPVLSNQSCRECHADVWREWESSFHARAWSDANVQAAFRHFGFDRKCQSCHAPEPVYVTGLTATVALRASDPESGVNCLSCHALEGGSRVAAANTNHDAACRPVKTASLTSGEMCGVCHDAIFDDWNASRYRDEGKTCQSCHMQKSATRTGGVDHLCPGGHNDDLVKSGVRMTCERRDDELLISVTNHATGHNFPGERHNRILLLEMIQTSADGAVELAQQAEIKGITPFRGESSAEQIRVDQSFQRRFPVVETAATARVRLLYKRFPWHSDREALVVHEIQYSLADE